MQPQQRQVYSGSARRTPTIRPHPICYYLDSCLRTVLGGLAAFLTRTGNRFMTLYQNDGLLDLHTRNVKPFPDTQRQKQGDNRASPQLPRWHMPGQSNTCHHNPSQVRQSVTLNRPL